MRKKELQKRAREQKKRGYFHCESKELDEFDSTGDRVSISPSIPAQNKLTSLKEVILMMAVIVVVGL